MYNPFEHDSRPDKNNFPELDKIFNYPKLASKEEVGSIFDGLDTSSLHLEHAKWNALSAPSENSFTQDVAELETIGMTEEQLHWENKKRAECDEFFRTKPADPPSPLAAGFTFEGLKTAKTLFTDASSVTFSPVPFQCEKLKIFEQSQSPMRIDESSTWKTGKSPEQMGSERNIPRDPEEAIGKRIHVFWPTEEAWFEGLVKRYVTSGEDAGTHEIFYDDGETHFVDLCEWAWKYIDSGASNSNPKTGDKRKRKLRSIDEKPDKRKKSRTDRTQTPSTSGIQCGVSATIPKTAATPKTMESHEIDFPLLGGFSPRFDQTVFKTPSSKHPQMQTTKQEMSFMSFYSPITVRTPLMMDSSFVPPIHSPFKTMASPMLQEYQRQVRTYTARSQLGTPTTFGNLDVAQGGVGLTPVLPLPSHQPFYQQLQNPKRLSSTVDRPSRRVNLTTNAIPNSAPPLKKSTRRSSWGKAASKLDFNVEETPEKDSSKRRSDELHLDASFEAVGCDLSRSFEKTSP